MVALYKNYLYICNVKLHERHEVAATSSVFCVKNLLENSKRNECGISNDREASAHEGLTTRIALSLCQTMSKKNDGVLIANTDLEAIRNFFYGFYSVPCIYKTIAQAYAELDNLQNNQGVLPEGFESVKEVLQQALMMVELLEPFTNEKEK